MGASLQPNVWAQIQRYGIETEPLPVVEGLRQAVVSGGRIVDLSDDDVARAIQLLDQFCSPGTTLFPEPYTPDWGPDPEGIGDRSFREQPNSVKADPVLYDWLESMCCAVAFGPLDKSAVTARHIDDYLNSGSR
ncbi:hypothetical protein ACIOG8_19185 [Streptomyces erythrochromogenes]|uniref:hypothetical protein n=1 Tax=Streptomyces erythrochromogenes TaxID=285574 RepID=UPI0038298908